MRPSGILTLSTLTFLTSAFPLQGLYLRQQSQPRPRATYSIVAIDGSDSSPQTIIKTEIRTITRELATTSSPTETETIIIATETVTAAPTSTSASSLGSQEYKGTSVIAPPQSRTFSNSPTTTEQVDIPTSWVVTTISTSYISSTSKAVLTTAVKEDTLTTPPPSLPTKTSKTYDDGMWHTTYPPWNATTPEKRVVAPPPPFRHVSGKSKGKPAVDNKGKKGEKEEKPKAMTTITANFKGKVPPTKAGKMPTLPKITQHPDKGEEGVPNVILPTINGAAPS